MGRRMVAAGLLFEVSLTVIQRTPSEPLAMKGPRYHVEGLFRFLADLLCEQTQALSAAAHRTAIPLARFRSLSGARSPADKRRPLTKRRPLRNGSFAFGRPVDASSRSVLSACRAGSALPLLRSGSGWMLVQRSPRIGDQRSSNKRYAAFPALWVAGRRESNGSRPRRFELLAARNLTDYLKNPQDRYKFTR